MIVGVGNGRCKYVDAESRDQRFRKFQCMHSHDSASKARCTHPDQGAEVLDIQ
jgi:hypothetical protein